MGNCLTRTRQHERLDDFPESGFENKTSYTQPTAPLWKRRKGFGSQWQQSQVLTAFDHQDSFGMPEESPNSLDTTCETSLISFPQEEFLESRYDGSQDEYGRTIAANKKDSISQPIENPLDQWRGRRRGGALELRLAKNRYLQLATSAHNEQGISPISMDPSIRSVAGGHASSKKEALKDEFEYGMSNGVVWEEYTRRRNVTAIAMSRNSDWMKDANPLLLAVGTEDGVLTLVEILDQHTTRDASPSQKQLTSDNLGIELNISLNGRIRAIDFSPDSSYVVVGGDGCVAYVMKIVRDSSTRRLKEVSVFQEVERVDRIYAISFSPDNQLLSVGGFDSSVAFVQLSLLDSEDNFQLTEVHLRGLAICLDWNQTKVAVGTSGENGFAVIDESFQIIHHVHRHAAVEVVRWKPDGSLLAVGDREVVLFDARTFDVVCELKDIIPSQKGMKKKYRIKAMCFSPDGSFLAIGGSDGICHVVESNNFALVYKLQRSSAPTSLAWGRQKLPSQGQKSYLGISDNSRAVVLFKAGIAAAHDKEDSSVHFSALDSAKATKGDTWVLREGSFRDIEETAEQSPERSRAIGTITSIVFSRSKRRPNSSYLAYVSNDCSLTILSTRDWKLVLHMEFPKPIRSISFSYSNNYLALGGDEAVLYVLSVPNRSMILNMIYDSPIQTVAFSRDDERLSIGMSDGMLSLLAPNDDWSPCGEIDYSDSPVLCQDWCSSYLAIGRSDGSVTVFDKVKTMESVFVPAAEQSDSSRPIRSVSFGTGGRFLVFGGDAGNVSIVNRKEEWSSSQIKLRCQVLATKWSPGGRYVLFTGLNQTLRMIDTLTGDEVQAIRAKYSEITKGHDDVQDLTSVDFSKCGNYIAFGCSNGSIHILKGPDWDLVGPPI